MPVQRNIVYFPRSDSQKYWSLTFKMRFDRKEFLLALLPLLLFGFGTEASRKADGEWAGYLVNLYNSSLGRSWHSAYNHSNYFS